MEVVYRCGKRVAGFINKIPMAGSSGTAGQFDKVIIFQHTRFRYLSHHQAAKALASLRICTDSPESLLLG